MENSGLALVAELLATVVEPVEPKEGRFSSWGNWKGKDTGTRPRPGKCPGISKPSRTDVAELGTLPPLSVETLSRVLHESPCQCSGLKCTVPILCATLTVSIIKVTPYYLI